jgi:hypothetical protein
VYSATMPTRGLRSANTYAAAGSGPRFRSSPAKQPPPKGWRKRPRGSSSSNKSGFALDEYNITSGTPFLVALPMAPESTLVAHSPVGVAGYPNNRGYRYALPA